MAASTWHKFGGIRAGVSAISTRTCPELFFGSVAWGDYDNDGRLDLALTGETGPTEDPVSLVFRNTGSGFTNGNIGLPGVRHGHAAWGRL